MWSSLLAITAEPVVLVAALIGVVFGIAIEQVRAYLRRRSWEAYRRARQGRQPRGHLEVVGGSEHETQKPAGTPRSFPDSTEQLRVVMSAGFSAQPVLNKSEARVFHELEAMVSSCNPRWLVMAQVSLGEVLRSQNADAYRCINSKRVDLLLVDENCHPRHVVEYQGAGHHQGTAAARDAVKKEALRRAGIGYHEVVAGQTTPSELKRLVTKLVEPPSSQPGAPQRLSDPSPWSRPPSADQAH